MATVNEKMKAIADAIRAKTGKTDPLTLDGMAAEIAAISGGGGTPAIGTCELEVYYDGEKYFYFHEEVVCTMGSDEKTSYQKNASENMYEWNVNHPQVECGSAYILNFEPVNMAEFECSGVEPVSATYRNLGMVFRVTAGPGEKATIHILKK